ncbi:2-oxoglutarate dehydrogenase E2 component [Algoriphagus ratkowskyi]|uniref:Dihydrolipoyllysine-residue succinyltransferase component of 2-oxoglutarate dehydrogenase complex n=1 Tax=Algoriphagus ratkowskyi TaxID=57028 RepID=A0A2W7RNQ6_9BACT|nr:2-oxoglutarate dehydrogenase complex dihydrolipoyllysine-residue succinyltransferase [Algoriphagus ratkowskyi]PZX60110.1 2-oxoglutarate dehydrogenase E2 component [Algoriphagus ratkowskyi]TXD75656.1 2-oxoglutarate dehydrogenase complex dihydrolipoyllysine-residue succinyltransferase [Algoriphagus ratkowskyi]
MSKEIKVPTVGESISEVTIGQWFKKDGDEVQMDEVLCELESDKATFELPAEAAGILRIKAQEGDVLEIGAVICEIDEAGTAGKSETAAEKPKAEAAPKTEEKSSEAKASGEVKDMVVPTVGESITEVTLANWIKTDGDYVKLDEIIAEVDSDKATFELPAEASGILRHVAQEGDVLEIGGLICKIEVTEGEPASASSEKSSDEVSNTESGNTNYATGHASPAASKILAEKGVSPESVKGTGKDGRITKEDAQSAQKPAAAPAKSESKPAESSAPAPVAGSRNERRERMSSLRKTVARRLVSVKNETAMLTTFNEVNMKPIMDLRSKFKEQFKEKHGVGLGFMSFFTKAVCVALQEWPSVNAKIDGNEMIFNDFCDISIAVSAPKGLVVPVIRNAEAMSFDQIEKEVVRLAGKARDNKLSIEEMTGGTFTLTNGGIFGSMMSTPIINAPQSAILGMHNIVQRPMAVNGEVVILPMMYLALSYDHRIIDGRESVSFLVRVKELLEDPTRLLFGV